MIAVGLGLNALSVSGTVFKACLVTEGRLVGLLALEPSGHDAAAIHVIVEEAGGKISDSYGAALDYSRPFNGIVISNGVQHDELVSLAALL